MSLSSRLAYYTLLNEEYNNCIAIIASHAAVTGTTISGEDSTLSPENFVNDPINFYDEELVAVTESGGLFAIQMDVNRLAPKSLIKKSLFNKKA